MAYTETGIADKLLDHLADTKFLKRGVGPENFVYPVTVFEGVMHVMCKLEVGKVCDFDEAARTLGTRDIWNGESDHIIAVEPVPKHYNLTVPLEIARRLQFVSGNRTELLVFKSSTRLDRQTLRGVRELHPDSATELDRLLLSAQPAP